MTTVEAFAFLDALRASGRVSMWGASEYLQRECGLDASEAKRMHGLWIRTFDDGRSPVEQRAAVAEATDPPKL